MRREDGEELELAAETPASPLEERAEDGPGCEFCRDRDPPPPRCPACGLERSARPDWRAGGAASQRASAWSHPDDDVRLEYRLRVIAPPVVFALAFLAVQSEGWRSLFRTFITMWMHELGHAVTAWLSGFRALPGPWRTAISDERSLWLTLLILTVLSALGARAYIARRYDLLGALAAVALLLFVLTFGLGTAQARALVTFGGDAGKMIFGAALGLSFWVRPGTHIHTSWLRWGFLVMAALALADGMETWWTARADVTAIPYGLIEGVGESDPVKLEDRYGWTQGEMVSRFVMVGVASLVVVLARYGIGIWQTPPAMPKPELPS